MASFDRFYAFLLRSEKGYQNTPGDKGNLNSRGVPVGTNYGVSARVYEQYLGRVPTAQDMRQMSPSVAREIIHQAYWNHMLHGDEIQSQQLADAIGDITVTSQKKGLELATQWLLLSGYPVAARNEHNELPGDAIRAMNTMTPEQEKLYLNAFALDQRHYYAGLGEDYDRSKYGWDHRVTGNFPESDTEGWAETKAQNHYLTVKAIQQILGHGDPKKVDGHFGEQTQAAVQEYQRLHDLPATGYLDETTRTHLLQDIMANETAKSWGDEHKQELRVRDHHFLGTTPHEPTVSDHSWTLPDHAADTPVHWQAEQLDDPVIAADRSWASYDHVIEASEAPDIRDQNWASRDFVIEDHHSTGIAEYQPADNIADQQSDAGVSDEQHSAGFTDQQGATNTGVADPVN